MVKVKGLYDGKAIQLLEMVDFPELTEKEALNKQFKTMKKGFDMGRILIKSREELYER